MTRDEERGPYLARACRSCSLSRTACEAERDQRGGPCCEACEACDHRDPAEVGEPSEDW